VPMRVGNGERTTPIGLMGAPASDARLPLTSPAPPEPDVAALSVSTRLSSCSNVCGVRACVRECVHACAVRTCVRGDMKGGGWYAFGSGASGAVGVALAAEARHLPL
jgi:hypothetical protein